MSEQRAEVVERSADTEEVGLQRGGGERTFVTPVMARIVGMAKADHKILDLEVEGGGE